MLGELSNGTVALTHFLSRPPTTGPHQALKDRALARVASKAASQGGFVVDVPWPAASEHARAPEQMQQPRQEQALAAPAGSAPESADSRAAGVAAPGGLTVAGTYGGIPIELDPPAPTQGEVLAYWLLPAVCSLHACMLPASQGGRAGRFVAAL